MIRAVRSNHPTFHSVQFTAGFNVILADRTKEETKKNTRNGLGKSTLIEIIHFCLGSGTSPNKGLRVKELQDWIFTLDFTLHGKEVSVSRSTSDPQRVSVEADTSSWPVKPKRNAKTGTAQLSVRDWNDLLGSLTFGLPLEEHQKYAPTFRGLISYFARRTRDAYSVPFENHRKQKPVDIQVFNAFLLGLEWRDARDFQLLKDRKRALEALQSPGAEIVVNEFWGSMGELEALRVRLRLKKDREAEQLDTFRVHPQYEEIAANANALTEEIHDLTNENVKDRRFLELYQKSVAEEKEPSSDGVDQVYAEAGVALPGMVKKRLDDVQMFHHTLIDNRRQFLRSEIERLTRMIESRRDAIRHKTEERAILMQTLRTHGALEEYTHLQQLHLQTSSQLQLVEQRIAELKKFEEGKSALAIDQELLLQRARRDLEERTNQRNRAIDLFNSNSQVLYKAPGNLVIEIQPSGFVFNVEIERSGSQGIDSMKVFCYDLILAQLWSQREVQPGFLIHDSMIFDGVDERQVASALELAEERSPMADFQYICTLNTDTIPWKEFSPNFNLQEFARLTLTDASEDGCLMGIRY